MPPNPAGPHTPRTRYRPGQDTPSSAKDWLMPVEAAEVIDVTPSAITRAIRKGHLPALPSGRSYLISRADLDEYDRQRQRGAASPWYRRGAAT